ncbi:RAD55 family ATPase [Halovenus marina]|uniref:RAD55 family ATPase n=1 Tax=Halovenus marina TaxID=3396621 RepID=UPI003F57A7E1
MYDLGTAFENATLAPGQNVLVAGPPLIGKRRRTLEALAAGADRGDGSIIVTSRDDADRVLADIRSLVSNPDDARLGIVDCVTHQQGRADEDSQMVKYASSPVDMSGIGIKVSAFLEEFSVEAGIEQNRMALDSLTPLLVHSGLQTVFRFMHVLTRRIEAADAVGLHIIESTAHDPKTVNTLKQLFDGVIEVDPDRSASVQLSDGIQTTG